MPVRPRARPACRPRAAAASPDWRRAARPASRAAAMPAGRGDRWLLPHAGRVPCAARSYPRPFVKRLATLVLTTTLLAGCAERPEPAPQAEPVLAHDIYSYARPAEARVTHVDLDLVADFDARRLAGTATLDIAPEAGADSVVLDVRTLDIQAVTSPDGQALEYGLGDEDPILGRPLTVRLPEG